MVDPQGPTKFHSAESLVQSMIERKPSSLIKSWTNDFKSLDSPGHIGLDPSAIEIHDEPRLVDGWQLVDKSNGRRYYVGKRATSETIGTLMEFFIFVIQDLKAVVSLSLPDEGPLDEQRGVDAFDDYSFWPMAKHENRSYVLAGGGQLQGKLSLLVDKVDTFDDESVISRIEVTPTISTAAAPSKATATGGETSEIPGFASSRMMRRESLSHIQHVNWPPDGFPPSCTFSVLRTIGYIHQDSLHERPAPFSVLVTCSNGNERSAAFALLSVCISRMRSTTVQPIHDVLIDLIRLIRGGLPPDHTVNHPAIIRHLGTFLWLNYALIEHAYASTMMLRKEKEEKRARAWLLKLRAAVYRSAMAAAEDGKS